MTAGGYGFALDRHRMGSPDLDAIVGRDLAGYAATVAPDEVVPISATGEWTTSADHLSLHEEWFASPAWSLETDVLHTRQGGDLGTAVIALTYREGATEVPSLLSLVFQRRDGRWLQSCFWAIAWPSSCLVIFERPRMWRRAARS